MHRIDTSTAQKDKFGAGKNGFTSGNAQTGVPATEVSHDILDALQEEIAAVIEDQDSGIALDKTKNNQLVTAIKRIISSVGMAATELARGSVKLATQLQVDAGNADDVVVTPKKLRFGFSANFSVPGYVAFPSFFGGFIIQWGRFNVPPNSIGNMVDGSGWDFALPLSFPTIALVSIASFGNPNTGGTGSEVSRTKIYLKNSHSGTQAVNWIAIGK
ncbi:gp53-like domain-containing protein [Aeromonas dhakensis]|uniref:gp53-like domain-containing protein n=1 Tax=Aeromonas dhakensis TaxID=196024 RepID=UPI003F799246